MGLIDLTGQKFGRLKVVRRSYPNAKDGRVMWLCRCECGIKKDISGHSLKGGDTKSCGCLKKKLLRKSNKSNPFKLDYGIASMRNMISHYKRHAKERGYKYKLTEEQFKEITKKDCHYCGAKPNNINKNIRMNGDYIYNGIDRIDNNKGYTIDNIVPCCKKCNRAKDIYTLPEFKDWIKRVHNNMFVLKEVT